MVTDVLSVSVTSDERNKLLCRSPAHKNAEGFLHSPIRSEKEKTQAATPTSPTSTIVLQLPMKSQSFVTNTKSSPDSIPIRPVRRKFTTKSSSMDTLSFSFDDDSSCEGGKLLGLRCLDDSMNYSETSTDDQTSDSKMMSDGLMEILSDDEGYMADIEGKMKVYH